MFSSGTSNLTGGNDGFWSQIEEGFGEGLSRIGADLLPIWSAQQLGVQSKDQLARPTFDPNAAPQRINDGQRTTTGVATTGQSSGIPSWIFWAVGGFGVALLGVAILRGR